MTNDTATLTRAEMLARATETLNGLDSYALGIVADRARLALDVQEGTKAAILTSLRGDRLQPVPVRGTETADESK